VRVPDGCLLLQAGRQLAWLTGGDIREGFHEVVCSQGTLEAIERRRKCSRPLWRVSSTVFSHVAANVMLRPVTGSLNAEEYKPIRAGAYVESELHRIELAKAAVRR
jgi:hypothetical protein